MTINFFEIIRKEFQIESPEDDLYEILPRFVDEEFVYDYIKNLLHKPIWRDFEWRGEICQLIIIPAFVKDDSEREKKFAFTSKQLEKHLAAGNIHLSQKQIQRSMTILTGTDFKICRRDHRLMFKLINILVTTEGKSDVQFLIYPGI